MIKAQDITYFTIMDYLNLLVLVHSALALEFLFSAEQKVALMTPCLMLSSGGSIEDLRSKPCPCRADILTKREE